MVYVHSASKPRYNGKQNGQRHEPVRPTGGAMTAMVMRGAEEKQGRLYDMVELAHLYRAVRRRENVIRRRGAKEVIEASESSLDQPIPSLFIYSAF